MSDYFIVTLQVHCFIYKTAVRIEIFALLFGRSNNPKKKNMSQQVVMQSPIDLDNDDEPQIATVFPSYDVLGLPRTS